MFDDDANVDEMVDELAARYSAEPRFIYRHALNGASIVIADELVADVASHPGVRHIETNGQAEFMAFPDDQEVPTWAKRSGLDVEHPIADIDGGGPDLDVDIAILDTGIDGSHPDLNVHAATSCVWGREGEDPPVLNGCTVEVPAGGDPTGSIDIVGHGTRVAGAAAARDNGFGIVGTAPGARIWSVNVRGNDTLLGGVNSDPGPFMDSFAAAFDWVAANADSIEVASTSLGFTGNSTALRTAIQGTVSLGIVVFAAAGNDLVDIYGADDTLGTSDDVQPAAYPEVAAISGYVDTDGVPDGLGPNGSAGETDDEYWVAPGGGGSNHSRTVEAPILVDSPGAAIDFAMPAVDIMTTCDPDAIGEFGAQGAECLANADSFGGHYGRATGTSFAAPQAAGLAALLIARHGSRDFNGDLAVNAADVYAIRQALIDMAVAQDNSAWGLEQPSGDPDSNPEPLGTAGMVLNFDVTTFSLADTGAFQNVTVDTSYVPSGLPETVQLNIIHDSTKFTISNPECTGAMASGTAIPPVANSGGTGTVIGCTLAGGPVLDSGPVMTFDVVAANNGTQTFTLDQGGLLAERTGFIDAGLLMMNASSPSFDITFSATINGSFGLQAVATQDALTAIAPTATAIMSVGAATPDVTGVYDPATGTFSIDVTEPGSYNLLADASGFISQLYDSVDVSAAGVVSSLPAATTLSGGDVDGDDDVDTADMSLILASFSDEPVDRTNGSGGIVDLDADGIVSGADISALISNLFVAGPETWPAP